MEFCFALTFFNITTFLRDSTTKQCEADNKEHKSTIKFSCKFFTISFHTCHVLNQYKRLHYFILSNMNNVTCVQNVFAEIFPEITRRSC